jgi:hypothetical protein
MRRFVLFLMLLACVQAQTSKIFTSGLGIRMEYPADWQEEIRSDGPAGGWENCMEELWFPLLSVQAPPKKDQFARMELMVARVNISLEAYCAKKVQQFGRTQDTSHLSQRAGRLGSLAAVEVEYDTFSQMMNATTGKMRKEPMHVRMLMARQRDAVYIMHFAQFSRVADPGALRQYQRMASSFRVM